MSLDLKIIRDEIKRIEEELKKLKKLPEAELKVWKDRLKILKSRAADLEARKNKGVTRIEQVRLARDIKRPTSLDIIRLLCTDFMELKGDRLYGDDPAMIGGIGLIESMPFTIIGHQKGNNTKENLYRNFGMASPEGYRKAMRLIRQAEKFHRPIITLIDTPGAYPGVGAEERGQAEAIARNLRDLFDVRTIILAFVTGEGGSGGALAISIADRIFMFENAMYSVISPEGCASILWKDSTLSKEALEALKPMASDMEDLGLIDGIVEEPKGGFQSNPAFCVEKMKQIIIQSVKELETLSPDELIEKRFMKFRWIDSFKEE
ncbi:MAG: acetyl-CoA carboxylase carboxyltransferase subunit alpha [Candidatus Delongbacteria bacterium]|nr:acetyl-CoA carboxylase carboxyltransferase subunit alpha [Candidatus Delongbacteria bacterium]